MEHITDWISGLSAFGSLVISIIALAKANQAINNIKNVNRGNKFEGDVGRQVISGSNNKTATGAGNSIS